LMVAYQTPDVGHEENWMQIVALTMMQLWLARDPGRSDAAPMGTVSA